MPKIVKNHMSGKNVLYAEERLERPHIDADDSSKCPFCRANSSELPLIKFKSENVMVTANKYPALTNENTENYGIHEVVVDTPEHHTKTHQLPIAQIVETLQAINFRVAELTKDDKIKQVHVFKNEGSKSGASISHSHWQILATSFSTETAAFDDPFIEYSVENEVLRSKFFVVFCPNASNSAHEVWFVPVRRVINCTELSNDEITDFANMLKRCISAVVHTVENLSYNLCFYNSPKDADKPFFARLLPRNTGMAGFELMTGNFINAVTPQKAACDIRKFLS